jgi:hypothetical protein
MSISYPLTPPGALRVAKLTLTARAVVGVAESPFTLEQQVYTHPGQGWMAEVYCPPLLRANAEQVLAFLLALNGRQGTFYLGDSAATTPRGTIAGSATCYGTQTAAGTTLTLTGHTGTLAVGDWLQISTSLYKVTQVNSAGNVDVWPRLRSAHAGGTAITYNSAKGVFRLTSSATKWDIDAMRTYGIAFSASEAL